MSDKPEKNGVPYATFTSFANFINKLRETTVPHQIDPSVFGNASGSVSYSIIAALKSLKLIAPDGVVTPRFTQFVQASDEERKPLLLAILKDGYPAFWGGSIDLNTATAGQFDQLIRTEYEAKGSTVDKVAAFFLAAAKAAGLPINPHLAARRTTASAATSAKSKRQRKSDEPVPSVDGVKSPLGNVNSPLRHQEISHKALEYKLVDLLKEDGINAEQQSAIWILIQLLASKSKAKSASETPA